VSGKARVIIRTAEITEPARALGTEIGEQARRYAALGELALRKG
jgi:hypothetical protein